MLSNSHYLKALVKESYLNLYCKLMTSVPAGQQSAAPTGERKHSHPTISQMTHKNPTSKRTHIIPSKTKQRQGKKPKYPNPTELTEKLKGSKIAFLNTYPYTAQLAHTMTSLSLTTKLISESIQWLN